MPEEQQETGERQHPERKGIPDRLAVIVDPDDRIDALARLCQAQAGRGARRSRSDDLTQPGDAAEDDQDEPQMLSMMDM